MKKLYLSILFFFSATAGFCQPGTIDSSFGANGISVTGITKGSVHPRGSVVLKNDNIVVLASVTDADNKVSTNLLQYLPDGKPDNSFGEKGSAVITSQPPSPTCLALLKDEKFAIAAIGSIGTYIGTSVFKIKANGSRDSSFGTNGITTDASLPDQRVADIAGQPDGKLVICGYYTFDPDRGIDYALLTRFNEDGTLDKTFGKDGHVINESFSEFTGITVQPDGKVLCLAQTSVLRYNTDGSPDKEFGEDGVATPRFDGAGIFFKDIITQPDGKIVAVGSTAGDVDGAYPNMAVVRLNADGSLDETFGEEGMVPVVFEAYTNGTSVVLQNNLKIVVVGSTASESFFNMCVGRLMPNGVIDSSFGMNGKTVTAIENRGEETYQVNLQSNGKIVVGSLSSMGNNDFSILARYYGDPVKEPIPITRKIIRWVKKHWLYWQPVNDKDVAYYSIQQSSNGINGFKEIGKVAGNKLNAVSKENNIYSYALPANAQTTGNYYRVTAVSSTGSNIVSEVIAEEDVSAITISPNPVKDVMRIAGLNANQKSTINIISRNGTVVQTAVSNSSTFNLNIAQLKSGVYTVQVISNGKTQTVKVVKE